MKKKIIIPALLSSLIMTTFINTNHQALAQDTEIKVSDTQKEFDEMQMQGKVKKFDQHILTYINKIKRTKEKIDALSSEKDSLVVIINTLEQQINKNREEFEEKVRNYQHVDEELEKLDSLFSANNLKTFFDRLLTLDNAERKGNEFILNYIQLIADLEESREELDYISSQISLYEKELKDLKDKLNKINEEKNGFLSDLLDEKDGPNTYEISQDEEKKLIDMQETLKKKEEDLKNKNKNRPSPEELKQVAVQQLKGKIQKLKDQNNDPNSYQRHTERNTADTEGYFDVNEIGSGLFIKPATGSITSQFGQRWGTLHPGIDIGKNGRSGDVPIISAASGTVIRAYYSSSYGNVVFLRHNLNGKTYTTVYAHMERFYVSVGQQLKQGQVIGLMGNTGYSTGPHLHFEIHEGDWNINKTNAVNPLKYIK